MGDLCAKGRHLLDEQNAWVLPDGRLRCRQCMVERRLGKLEGEGELVACLFCGAQRRILSHHLKQAHGMDAKARKAYPGPLVAEAFREIQRELYRETRRDKLPQKGKPLYGGMCRRGLHRLSGKNILIVSSTGRRTCRACFNDGRRKTQPQPLK